MCNFAQGNQCHADRGMQAGQFARCIVFMLAVISPLMSQLLSAGLDSWQNKEFAHSASREVQWLDAIPGGSTDVDATDAWLQTAHTSFAVRPARCAVSWRGAAALLNCMLTALLLQSLLHRPQCASAPACARKR